MKHKTIIAKWLFISGISFLSLSQAFAENRTINLTVSYKTVNFTGKTVQAIAVNNQIPGPTLHFKEGDEVNINVYNHLNKGTIIHWHGIILPWQMDGVEGVSQPAIPPGGVFHYHFKLRQSGTYWYHSHAGLQEQRGLYGAFIIDPPKPPPYHYDKDEVIILSDWINTKPEQVLANLKKDGDYYSPRFPLQPSLMKFIHDYRQASPEGKKALVADYKMMQQMRMGIYDLSDVAYDAFLLNGQSNNHPWTTPVKVGDVVRLRFIGASASTNFRVKVVGATMQMVHVEGNNIKPYTVNDFTITPGETYDVLVKIQKNQPYIIYAESADTVGAAYGALVTNSKQTVNYKSVEPFPEPIPVTREMMNNMAQGMGHTNMNMNASSQSTQEDSTHHMHDMNKTLSQKSEIISPQHASHQATTKMKMDDSMPMDHNMMDMSSEKDNMQPNKDTNPHQMTMDMSHDSMQMDMKMDKNMPMNHTMPMTMPSEKTKTSVQTIPNSMPNMAMKNKSASMDHQAMSSMTPGTSMSMNKKMAMSQPMNMAMQNEPTIKGDVISTNDKAALDLTTTGTKYQNLVAAVKTNEPNKPIAGVIRMELFGYMDRYIWMINGLPEYKAKPIIIEPGKRYRIIFTNESMMHHPMHIHGHWFILRNGHGVYDPLLHTIDVPPGATVVADIDADASGQWIFHCHHLYHMMTGMTRVFQYSTIIEVVKGTAKPQNYVAETPYVNRPIVRKDEVIPIDSSLIAHPMAHMKSLYMASFLDIGNDFARNIQEVNFKGLYGGDYNKLELYADNAQMEQGTVSNADLDIFYWRLISQFWAVKGGVNYFYRPAEHPYWQPGIGIEGLMPYFIDTNVRTYLYSGSVKFDIELSRDTQITNNFFIRTGVESIFATKTVSGAEIGSGMNEMQYTLRPYYRIRPGVNLFAQYQYTNDYGALSSFDKQNNESPNESSLTLGVSLLF